MEVEFPRRSIPPRVKGAPTTAPSVGSEHSRVSSTRLKAEVLLRKDGCVCCASVEYRFEYDHLDLECPVTN